jgi:hypothetical protein
MLAKTHHHSTPKNFFYTLSEHRTSVESNTQSFFLYNQVFYFALRNKRGVNGMAMDGREASNANQGFRGVFLPTYLELMAVARCGYLLHLHTDVLLFLASLFRFSIFDS